MQTSKIKRGDRVKVIGIPPNLPDDRDLKTRSLFEKCLGVTFEVMALERVDDLDVPLVRLDVGSVVGKKTWEHTIWIEPKFVEIVSDCR